MIYALSFAFFVYLMGCVVTAAGIHADTGKLMDDFDMDDWFEVGLWPFLTFIALITATWSE